MTPLICAALVLVTAGTGLASQPGYHYAGIEYYGSSQISKLELEKLMALKPGAPLVTIDRAVQKLRGVLTQRFVNSNVEVVSSPPDLVFVAVDISDTSTDTSAPVRKLKQPHHVVLSSEKPFLLLDQLEVRQQKLVDEGRTFSETLKDGIRYYSDEPCNQIVDQMLKLVPYMRNELLQVVNSDPDPNRRRRSVELLHWAGDVPSTCLHLIPALDDADAGVRAAVARYMFPRLERLPSNFPFDKLVESFSRELSRPSHQDRSKALYSLLAICGQQPLLINNVKVFDEEQVRKIDDLTVIPSIKEACEKLLQLFANPPKPPPQYQMMPQPRPESGF